MTAKYQAESGDGEEDFQSTVDKERAEKAQAVVPQMFERKLEDVSPANTAQIDLLCWAVRSTTQQKELNEVEQLYFMFKKN